jgi:hypothetical protein
MRRRLFNLLAALSLLAALVVAGLWVRSYWACECVEWQYRNHELFIGWNSGKLLFQTRLFGPFDHGTNYGIREWVLFPEDHASWWEAAGFRWGNYGNGDVSLEVGAPCWFLAPLSLLLPTAWWLLRRRLRERLVHCRHFGYDLRATPRRCPECGTENQLSEESGKKPDADRALGIRH